VTPLPKAGSTIPATEAGRSLTRYGGIILSDMLLASILAIEAEARATPDTRLRDALEQIVGMFDRLDAQARHGGGPRGTVEVTVQLWNDMFRPLRVKALVALDAG